MRKKLTTLAFIGLFGLSNLFGCISTKKEVMIKSQLKNNLNYVKENEKLIARAIEKKVILPEGLSRFNDYRKKAQKIIISEGACGGMKKIINFRFVTYKNSEIGDVQEFYRYINGQYGDGIINKDPVLYHFDINKNGIEKVNEDWPEFLYDGFEDGLNKNEIYEKSIYKFQDRFFPQ